MATDKSGGHRLSGGIQAGGKPRPQRAAMDGKQPIPAKQAAPVAGKAPVKSGPPNSGTGGKT